MKFYRSEITAIDVKSDNPIHQRLFFGYFSSKKYVKGKTLEIGCGVGRGLGVLMEQSDHYTAIDKNEGLIKEHSEKFPDSSFIYESVPPLSKIEAESIDTVVTYHVIEHIPNDELFIDEIYRVLKKGGKAVITTPNKKLRIARNPWHVREYNADELETLVKRKFSNVKVMGITGNEKVMKYYQENKRAVDKLMRWDFLKLQYLLPAFILRIPYDILNRRNRQKLMDNNTELSDSIDYTDYYLTEYADGSLDHFFVVEK
ncbi:MAG: class I SAM-dependent methyltransferase [Cytophagales bacterium]|nr:class I SAM-dependent methyltransferase [Cytophagales bacterium]